MNFFLMLFFVIGLYSITCFIYGVFVFCWFFIKESDDDEEIEQFDES